MRNTILVGAIALISAVGLPATAKINQGLESKFFGDIRCKEQVYKELAAMKATREWSLPNAREMDGSRRFHSPSEITGVWVEARIFMNNEVLLRRITAKYVETRTFNLNTCTIKKTARKSRELFDSPQASEIKFTDRELRLLLQNNPRGLVYVWSPNMPYSYQQRIKGKSGIEIVKEVAGKLGLHVTIVLDPHANAGYARQIIAQNDYMKTNVVRSAHSIELALRAMNTHFPALIVYANGRLSRHGYPGLGTAEEYTKFIRGELNELQK